MEAFLLFVLWERLFPLVSYKTEETYLPKPFVPQCVPRTSSPCFTCISPRWMAERRNDRCADGSPGCTLFLCSQQMFRGSHDSLIRQLGDGFLRKRLSGIEPLREHADQAIG